MSTSNARTSPHRRPGATLRLSTRCEPVAAAAVASETRAFLARHGVDVDAVLKTDTPWAVPILAAQLQGADAHGRELRRGARE